jgi:hypothetical protein
VRHSGVVASGADAKSALLAKVDERTECLTRELATFGLGNTLCNQSRQQRGIPAMVKTRAEAAQYLKDAGGLKLVVFGADGHEVAAMFVQGSVRYDEEEATFLAVAEGGHTVGELFVDETVGYDENIDAFVIRTAQ